MDPGTLESDPKSQKDQKEIAMGRAPSKSVTMVEAKTHLADWVRAAESGEPVLITRHGRPVAALVAVQELDRLRALRAAGPKSGLISVAGGWEGSEELAEILSRHRRSLPRAVPELE